MKRALTALAVLGTVAVLLLWWLFPPGMPAKVEIPAGRSAGETAVLLKKEGVIRSVLVFKLVGKLTKWDRSLKPGLYELKKPMGEPFALWKLYEGKIESVRVPIPEGFMAKQIADRLEAAGITDGKAFMDYVRANNLEGFLFPTTYLFAKSLPAESVAHTMHEEFKARSGPLFKESGESRYTLHQIVTLAAIVQREARAVDEMPTIAAVYRNRLVKRMRLEADPTVQYAYGKDTGEWMKGMRFKHLEIDSPYNTYRFFGLPPGPICSPGADAIKASLSPAKVDFLYFVADGETGRHSFSRTLVEHNAAIARNKALKKPK
ncbi:MAG: endolytic transglycosylase MltG [Elusimicrobia bacterium]|nr:endolytic transglycosylase MltG [Elusimicrobiota bacterium]